MSVEATRVYLVPHDLYAAVEPDVRGLLAPVVARSGGRETMDAVWESIEAGHHQLWMIFNESGGLDGAMVSHIKAYTQKRMLVINWLAGDNMADWIDEVLDALEQFAKLNECGGLELVGRHGWMRFLKGHGWETPYIMCERKLPETSAQETRHG